MFRLNDCIYVQKNICMYMTHKYTLRLQRFIQKTKNQTPGVI